MNPNAQQASRAAAWLGGNIDDALAEIRVPAFILGRDGVIRWQNEQIAASLGIARETVRNHVRGLLRALRVYSRLEAVVEARRRGLLDP